jgi:aminoglycoside 6'-N-acetyltransferase I
MVRRVEPADAKAWLAMRVALWPDVPNDHEREIAEHLRARPDSTECLVAELSGVGLVGFVEVGLRAYAEGCLSSPVGYLEGIWVDAAHRHHGTGRRLVEGAERWAMAKECTEMASDRLLENEASGLFHAAVGYTEVERIVCFRRSLSVEAA